MNGTLLRMIAALFFLAVMNVGIVMAVGAPHEPGTILAAQYGDTTPPNVTITSPSGLTAPDIAISATYDDVDSGINQNSVTVDLDGIVLSGCSVGPASVSCAASGLAEGWHQVQVHLQDNSGNGRNVGTGFQVDATAPEVIDIFSGSVFSWTAVNIGVSFSDALSGADPSTATIAIDGNTLSGCAIFGFFIIDCQVADLSAGMHTYTGSVSDRVGNTASFSGYFTIECDKTNLGLNHAAYWSSYADYLARTLSVQYEIVNNGPRSAYNISVIGGSSSNGVLMAGGIPVNFPDAILFEGDTISFEVTYLIPGDVTMFYTNISVTAEDDCGNSYTYP